MSNLTSTQPGAFDAFYALLVAAGAALNPPVTVLDTEIVQYEPGSYVLLSGFDDHQYYEWAALGSFAFYETYNICGFATYVQGDIDPKGVRDATFSLYQNIVMATVVANRGAAGTQVLGAQAPTALEWIIPVYARYTAGPGNFGGTQQGIAGEVEFAFQVKARITVP